MNQAVQVLGVPDRLTRARVVEIDLAKELGAPPPPKAAEPEALLAAVWLCKDPVGMVLLDQEVTAESLYEAIVEALGPSLANIRARHGIEDAPTGPAGWIHRTCSVQRSFARVVSAGPAISVVICTRDRSDSLRRCLESLTTVRYQAFEIVVIDNAPSDSSTSDVCREFHDRLPLRYAREDVPGLSRARNRAYQEAAHAILAFIDDDERVHPDWLGALAIEFERSQSVGAVSGLVLPAELRTEPQVQFETFGGHSKGRGFQRVVFDCASRGAQSPLFPFPAFGVGANMAFRASALERIGLFDLGLGAGTSTGGAEDTAAFAEVLLAGYTMVYAPAAVTWHYHRDDQEELSRQRKGYSRGLGAFYSAMLLRRPGRILALLRLIPSAARMILQRQALGGGAAHAARGSQAPPGHLRIGPVLAGPGAYLFARLAARRAERGGLR